MQCSRWMYHGTWETLESLDRPGWDSCKGHRCLAPLLGICQDSVLSPRALPQEHRETSGPSVGVYPFGHPSGKCEPGEAEAACAFPGCALWQGTDPPGLGQPPGSSRGVPRGSGGGGSRARPGCPLPSSLSPQGGNAAFGSGARPAARSPGPGPCAPRAGDSPGTATWSERCCWPTPAPPAWCLCSAMGCSLFISALLVLSLAMLPSLISPRFYQHTPGGRCPWLGCLWGGPGPVQNPHHTLGGQRDAGV